MPLGMLIIPDSGFAYLASCNDSAVTPWEPWDTNGLTCVTHRGAGKAWLKHSPRAEETKADDLPKKGQRKHLLLRITTKLTETGHMLTCWEDACSTWHFKDRQRRSQSQNMEAN